MGDDEAEHPLLTQLLQQHGDLFAEPQGLPPVREYDHRIHLPPGTDPVAVRPYRYPQLQKDELERHCALMLAAGIIRISTSPFSATVLLVRKSDGTWRFCIDYGALNALTLKDKFSIPMVDELFDELHGARFFTKLDLRSTTIRCACTRTISPRRRSRPIMATLSSWRCRSASPTHPRLFRP
jgi:hypothetical protein